MIDFALTPEQEDLQARTAVFVREKIIPFESDPRRTPHGPTDDLRAELVALGKADSDITI